MSSVQVRRPTITVAIFFRNEYSWDNFGQSTELIYLSSTEAGFIMLRKISIARSIAFPFSVLLLYIRCQPLDYHHHHHYHLAISQSSLCFNIMKIQLCFQDSQLVSKRFGCKCVKKHISISILCEGIGQALDKCDVVTCHSICLVLAVLNVLPYRAFYNSTLVQFIQPLANQVRRISNLQCVINIISLCSRLYKIVSTSAVITKQLLLSLDQGINLKSVKTILDPMSQQLQSVTTFTLLYKC